MSCSSETAHSRRGTAAGTASTPTRRRGSTRCPSFLKLCPEADGRFRVREQLIDYFAQCLGLVDPHQTRHRGHQSDSG